MSNWNYATEVLYKKNNLKMGKWEKRHEEIKNVIWELSKEVNKRHKQGNKNLVTRNMTIVNKNGRV
jgi:hypothetical protein